jgi:hypothetical protein
VPRADFTGGRTPGPARDVRIEGVEGKRRPAKRVRSGYRGTTAASNDRRNTVAEKAEKYNGYCVKCKEKRDFEGHVEISKTGMRMAKGKCPVCGTTVNRILGKA